jgi:hypothetical protein
MTVPFRRASSACAFLNCHAPHVSF